MEWKMSTAVVVDDVKETVSKVVEMRTKPKEKKVYEAKISSNWQIAIPKEVRELLDIKPGDMLLFIPMKDKVRMVKQKSLREEMAEWRSELSEETKAKIKAMAGWTAAQHREYLMQNPNNIKRMKERYGY